MVFGFVKGRVFKIKIGRAAHAAPERGSYLGAFRATQGGKIDGKY